MSSITKPVAKALAYRWGELQEEPPAFIDDLMIDLTTALAEAERSGDEKRAKCLDDVLDALAEGIVKHERAVEQDVNGEPLIQAIAEIRTYYFLKSGLPRAGAQKREASSTEHRESVEVPLSPDRVTLS